MSEKRFDFGVDIPTKITKYTKRFTDLEGFLDEDYDGEHHMLWDNQDECWIFLDDVLCLMEKEYMSIKEENEQLRKAEKINMEYAEQIVEENQKLRIAKNNLRRENEQLSIIRRDEIKYWKNKHDNAVETFDVDETTATKIRELEKENEQLKQKLENLGLNEKNDVVKMIEGKFFIRM